MNPAVSAVDQAKINVNHKTASRAGLHFTQRFCCSSTEEIDCRHRFIAIEAGNPARNADSLSKRPGNQSALNFPCYPWTVVWEKGFTGRIHRINRSAAFLPKPARKATFQIHHTDKNGNFFRRNLDPDASESV